nr:uncharacterized protein LOC112026735 [Quercus suber]
METSRRQEGMGQNQETGNFPIERNSDVSLTDVTTDGDRNFWEKNFQIQIQSQGNKEDTGKQENVGSQDRKEKEGWRESYVIEDYERSTDSNYWDPQVAKRAEQQRECHERMHDQVENDKLEKEYRSQIPLPPPLPGRGPIPSSLRQEGSSSTDLVDGKRRKVTANSPLEREFHNNARHELDSRIARMFYTSGLPFHFARNPNYPSSYAYVATHNIPSYVPSRYNALKTTLLWGPMFIKAIDGLGEFKDKHFIAGVLKDAIKEIGHEKVVQVITDNASVMPSVGALNEGEYPKIFWAPCVVHALNLALKNICTAKNTEKNEVTYEECSWITRIADNASFIHVFIMNHSMRLAMFNEFCPLKLLQFANIRFASVVVTLKRLKLIKRCLQAMAINDQWAANNEDDVGKAQKVKDMILSDRW